MTDITPKSGPRRFIDFTPFGVLGWAVARMIEANGRVARLRATPRRDRGVTRSDVHFL